MSYSIKVSANAEFQQVTPLPFFDRNFRTDEEFQAVVNLCDNKTRIGLFESLVIPIRTDNLNNFCKDFFLPTLINHALKLNDIALKIICSLVLTICDVITFPVRLITAMPRYLYNAAHPKETHPLYRYLIDNGVPAATLSADYVYLELSWVENRGVFGEEGKRNLVIQGETFNFIQLPIFVSNVSHGIHKQGLSNQEQQPMIEEVL